jgi:HSP20 family molecular chaperone IbpA
MGDDRFLPAMDVTTRGDDLIVKLELPGMDMEKDVDIRHAECCLLGASCRSNSSCEESRGLARWPVT